MKHTMSIPHKPTVLTGLWLHLLVVWLFFGLIQAAHFHWYYEQGIGLSLKWGLRDWLLWMLVVVVCYRWLASRFSTAALNPASVTYFVLMVLLAGALQILMVVVVDWLTDGISRPFWADFWHLYSKRWFQNMLIFLILWFALHTVVNSQRSKSNTGSVDANKQATPRRDDGKIKVTDGKQHLWLHPKDISKVEVSGNYLCFFTTSGQHVVRGTMKEMAAALSAQGFVRISRSCLLNQSLVESCQRISPSQVQIKLAGGDVCLASRRYWKEAKLRLGL